MIMSQKEWIAPRLPGDVEPELWHWCEPSPNESKYTDERAMGPSRVGTSWAMWFLRDNLWYTAYRKHPKPLAKYEL